MTLLNYLLIFYISIHFASPPFSCPENKGTWIPLIIGIFFHNESDKEN